jgi:hypothetical protein
VQQLGDGQWKRKVSMHVSQSSKLSSNVCCPVCGQGFLIYAEDGLSAAHPMNHRIIQHALRAHHTAQSVSRSVHPPSTFHIPCWSGAHPFLASATLSDLLGSAL